VRSRQYNQEILAPPSRTPAPPPEVAAEYGLVVEDSAAEFCGAVVSCEKDVVELEDLHGRRRVFPLSETFLLEGSRVRLVRPAGSARTGPARTASGSIAPSPSRARVARASRIYVEGKHDAELVEKVWGDDLRDVGVVVELLNGVDDLPAIAVDFGADSGRRMGVLVDHLVDGSKESRIAARVTSEYVLVVGHPFVDVWAAVRPSRVGIRRWPEVPRNVPWKDGVLAALGWPPDPAAAWRKILGCVRSYADLEPAFLGRVEELIDFVTAPGGR
jgi:Protein of unknown function (DUF3097)